MNPIIYNIPASFIQHYQGRPIIVRTADPTDALKFLLGNTLEQLAYLQVLSLESAGDELSLWGEGIPLDLCLQDPEREFSTLYRFSRLLDSHPVRISIPVRPGLSKAVKVAISLNFAVNMVLEQPDERLINELAQVLDFYLHHSTASQPVEFFHSLLLGMYHQEAVNLWTVQEEDPAYCRYVTEDGEEHISQRFVGRDLITEDIASFVEDFGQARLAEQGECSRCEFFDSCAGYFKWPNTNYSCTGIQRIFSHIRDAGRQLAEALEAFEQSTTQSL